LNALQKGADFKTLALQFSSDNLSYQNGGELPEFGVGRYDPAFETAAFALQKDGEISKPVHTEFGYHIIKRLQHIPAPVDKRNEKWRESIRQMISQSDRMEVSRKKLIKTIQQKTAFRKFSLQSEKISGG
jgi:peptidyl-prolyl cis-trans isomerase SurA